MDLLLFTLNIIIYSFHFPYENIGAVYDRMLIRSLLPSGTVA